MNVIVIGANGQIGRHLVNQLHASEQHEVTAMVRKEEQKKELEANGVNAVLADLEGSISDLEDALKGADAVVFTAGSGGHTGPEKTLLIDLDGAVKSIAAAKNTNVDRFVMVSAFQAHNRDSWEESPIKPYMVAKHFADEALVHSGLDYTIIRPGGLQNEPGTGKVQASENLERGSIPREDVAAVIVEALEAKNTYQKGFDLITGKDSISEALRKI
ncbi:SDR family oxidoreductase [Oceanobacillus neutriphilus]|uniref:Sugar epimerase YhfK n=1 Tax=Oceanobacillus neutriphilus TaxID=531815 RepID=A0ABQ2NTE9_9BACI|nr:SDR family oxidoreductase [Oceanobacillus neutriphilus]GGP09877.1 putative sugar epimerase YhfK [Oceanobacillus neutriphilus]